MDKLSLTLFITGQTMRSRSAVQNLQTLFEEIGGEPYELSIVDVLEHPQLAEDEKVVATPTLVKTSPLPVRRAAAKLFLLSSFWPKVSASTGKPACFSRSGRRPRIFAAT
mgnify:FL=1